MCEAQVNVRSTSECAKHKWMWHKWMCGAQVNVRSTRECAKHTWMCEAHVNVRSTSHCLFFGHPPACKPQQLQQVGVYYIFFGPTILVTTMVPTWDWKSVHTTSTIWLNDYPIQKKLTRSPYEAVMVVFHESVFNHACRFEPLAIRSSRTVVASEIVTVNATT